MKRLFLLFLIPLTINAESAQIFCFSELISLQSVRRKLTEIIIPSDQIQEFNAQCLQVSALNYRMPLFKNFLQKHFVLETTPTPSTQQLNHNVARHDLCEVSIVIKKNRRQKIIKLAFSMDESQAVKLDQPLFEIRCLRLDKNQISYKIIQGDYKKILSSPSNRAIELDLPQHKDYQITLLPK